MAYRSYGKPSSRQQEGARLCLLPPPPPRPAASSFLILHGPLYAGMNKRHHREQRETARRHVPVSRVCQGVELAPWNDEAMQTQANVQQSAQTGFAALPT